MATVQGVVELPLTAVVLDQLGLVLAILIASWATGTAVRQRRLYTEQFAGQAEERARASSRRGARPVRGFRVVARLPL